MILFLQGVFLKNEQKSSVEIDLARKASNIYNFSSDVIMKQVAIVVSFLILYIFWKEFVGNKMVIALISSHVTHLVKSDIKLVLCPHLILLLTRLMILDDISAITL